MFSSLPLLLSDAWREFGSLAEELAGAQTVAGVSERLHSLEERSMNALMKLPNGGRPDIGTDGMIREYRGVDTSMLPDPGHRHWSGLWALYPGFQVSVALFLHGNLTIDWGYVSFMFPRSGGGAYS